MGYVLDVLGDIPWLYSGNKLVCYLCSSFLLMHQFNSLFIKRGVAAVVLGDIAPAQWKESVNNNSQVFSQVLS